jgi:hypothetical protein
MLVYRPSKLSSLSSTKGGFTPTVSMAGLGEKLGMDPWISQSSCYELCWKYFFSRAVTLSIAVFDFVKCCYTWTT